MTNKEELSKRLADIRLEFARLQEEANKIIGKLELLEEQNKEKNKTK